MELHPGTRIRDYEIARLIGSGGMGEVWLALELMLDREVAIKRLNVQLTRDTEFSARFQNEARIQARLNHPNIVGMHAFFEEGGQYYMVLEFARGITLRELIDRTGPIPEQRTRNIFNQISAALGYAHANGIIHRDVKPSNIMVDPDNQDHVKMMDFGIARLLTEGHLTRTGTRMGTMHYMSPEQVLGERDIDQRSDVYSSGVVLYEMLSGRLPFNIDTDSEYVIQHKIVTEEIPDPRKIYPYISDEMVNLVRFYTTKDTRYRLVGFGSTAETRVSSPVIRTTNQLFSPTKVLSNKAWDKYLIDNMVLIKGGSFQMGSERGDARQKPVHRISLSSFYLSRFELTQREWNSIMNKDSSHCLGDEFPVDIVQWFDAIDYCNKLSNFFDLEPCYEIKFDDLSRKIRSVETDWSANGFRLPTEAEWEFASRGGIMSKEYEYSGSHIIQAVAWHEGNSLGQPHEVGHKDANELGMHDMSGNVWEWCWDWYDLNYYATSPDLDPRGPESGLLRVLRGGSWSSNKDCCRVSYRYHFNPESKIIINNIGFRLARSTL